MKVTAAPIRVRRFSVSIKSNQRLLLAERLPQFGSCIVFGRSGTLLRTWNKLNFGYIKLYFRVVCGV